MPGSRRVALVTVQKLSPSCSDECRAMKRPSESQPPPRRLLLPSTTTLEPRAMSYATPVRRPSHAPSSTPDVASPPPSFSRRVSAVSSAAPPPPSPSLAGSERKRRTRLRDYYALATPREGHHQLDLGARLTPPPVSPPPLASLTRFPSPQTRPTALTRTATLPPSRRLPPSPTSSSAKSNSSMARPPRHVSAPYCQADPRLPASRDPRARR